MEARRTIRDAHAGGTGFPASQAYDLVLQSTGSPSMAAHVFRELRRAELKQLDNGQA